jgi:ATP-dependent DNA helicase RecG
MKSALSTKEKNVVPISNTLKTNGLSLQTPISQLPLVGPSTAEKLSKLNIFTIKDLLFHVPFRYKDTSKSISIKQLLDEGEGMIIATCESISSVKIKRFFITKARVADESGKLNITWFNQPYITNQFKAGETYLIEGKVTTNKGFTSIVSPQFEKWETEGESDSASVDRNPEISNSNKHVHLGRIIPFYEATEGLTSKWIRARIFQLRSKLGSLIVDPLNESLIKSLSLLPLSEAVIKLHFPESFEDISRARERLGFDELLKLGISLEKTKQTYKDNKAYSLTLPQNLNEKFMKSMRFELTEDQQQSIKEILEDLSKSTPMRRLLNGDVGSGKTIVAVLACYTAICNGYSAVVMAPTTILAQQHYLSFKALLEPLGIRVISRMSGEKLVPTDKENLELIKSVETPTVIIGTHALLFEQNLPKNLALVVVDEQHRFGVQQREALTSLHASEGQITPHYLSMTATPIPRTLTTVLYGDMDVSFIKMMPKSRISIKSFYVPKEKRTSCLKWTHDQIINSNLIEQAFVIFPLVDESDKVQAKAAKTEYENLSKSYFKDLKVGLLHGQLKSAEKDEILMKFRNKEFNVLIATSVVEVGIDIPDATIMIIENADRFGLAQLHQFRGRVGRGDKQSYCYVLAGDQVEKDAPAIERLKYFCAHPSGFDVAQFDLQSRGPGEVYGNIQSGIPNLKIANILDLEMVARAREVAKSLIKSESADVINHLQDGLFA